MRLVVRARLCPTLSSDPYPWVPELGALGAHECKRAGSLDGWTGGGIIDAAMAGPLPVHPRYAIAALSKSPPGRDLSRPEGARHERPEPSPTDYFPDCAPLTGDHREPVNKKSRMLLKVGSKPGECSSAAGGSASPRSTETSTRTSPGYKRRQARSIGAGPDERRKVKRPSEEDRKR